MRLVPIDKIKIPPRQRQKRESAHVRELEESIAARGLLQAPGGWYSRADDTYILSWGESRYLACKNLHGRAVIFSHDGTPVPTGELPFTLLDEELSAADIFEVELDENIRRRDLTWQEKAQAISDLHKLRQSQNPGQTLTATATELSKATDRDTAALRTVVRDSVLVSEHLSNPKIAAARNVNEARALILKQEEERIYAAIARRATVASPQQDAIKVRQGDLLTILPTLDDGFVDLICGDPPYGIAASGAGFRSRTVHHHNYEDTPENARSILDCILTEGFRVTKSRANLFIFGSIDNWEYFKGAAGRLGWVHFPRPLIWGKSDGEGLAPWGGQGPRVTTEFIFYATKGRKGLISSPIDYLRVNRVPRNERIHAAEKPIELMKKLIEVSTLPGEMVLDPCCGSGSTLIAARELRRNALGIEKDKDYFDTALANIYKTGLEHGAQSAKVRTDSEGTVSQETESTTSS